MATTYCTSKTTFDSRCGGEYPHFNRMVCSFFVSLHRSAVTPRAFFSTASTTATKSSRRLSAENESPRAYRRSFCRHTYARNPTAATVSSRHSHANSLRAVADMIVRHRYHKAAGRHRRRSLDRCPLLDRMLSNDTAIIS